MNIFEFNQPEDIWGFKKPGISFVDRMGVGLPAPSQVVFERDPGVHLADGSAPPPPAEGEEPSTLRVDDAVQEIWLDGTTLFVHTIDDFTPGGFAQWRAVDATNGNVLAQIKVNLGPEQSVTMVADPNTPVELLTGDPRTPPVSAEA
jgi:hypothetical protein